MDNKLLKIWNEILKINDNIIRTRDEVTTMCFIIGKNYSIKAMALIFKDAEEKEKMKYFVKKLIINQEILAYIFISDAYMTNMETKEVQEVVMRSLYTPKEVLRSHIIHKGNEVIKKLDMSSMMQHDSWNLWENSEISPEENKYSKEYVKFRDENPELYK